jgi:hypothetical protein
MRTDGEILVIPVVRKNRTIENGRALSPITVANSCLCMYYASIFIEEKTMSVALKLSDELIDLAKPHAAAMHRSIPKQIEYWARLGKVVEDNPELPLQFIQDTLLGLEEAKAGQSFDYKFGV